MLFTQPCQTFISSLHHRAGHWLLKDQIKAYAVKDNLYARPEYKTALLKYIILSKTFFDNFSQLVSCRHFFMYSIKSNILDNDSPGSSLSFDKIIIFYRDNGSRPVDPSHPDRCFQNFKAS